MMMMISMSNSLHQPQSSPMGTYLIAHASHSHISSSPQQEKFFGGGSIHGRPYFPQLWCGNGEYSRWGQLLCAPLTQALRLVFHLGETLPKSSNTFEFEFDALLVLFVYTFVFMTWTFGVGAATGLFVPSLTVGATAGRLVGRWGPLQLK